VTFTHIFAFLSTAIALYCVIPYVQTILNKKTQPHQFTWLVFLIMNGMVFISQYLAGARDSVWISLIFFVASCIIFVLSLKYGIRGTSKFDTFLFCFALFAIMVWLLSKNNSYAIWLTVVIDLCATAMMMLKIWKNPYTEEPLPWLLGAVAYVFTCLTLLGQPVTILFVRPMYGLLIDSLLVAFIHLRRNYANNLPRHSPQTTI
jgi:hypothetical protein